MARRSMRRRGKLLPQDQVLLLQESRGLTREAIERLPEGAYRRSVRRLDYPDLPRARLAFRLLQAQGDNGAIPPQPVVTALGQLTTLRDQVAGQVVARIPTGDIAAPGALAVVPPTANLQNRKWEALGPGNIGGRTRTILVDPANPDTIWAGSAGGGIWRTDNGGQNWSPVDDFMANLAITSLVIDPRDRNRIYAATGEGFGALDAIQGGGIFQTRDQTTWSRIDATGGANFQSIDRLAISADGKVLLAATNSGLWRSEDDNRANWQNVLSDKVADVKFHPLDPNKAIAGSLEVGEAWVSADGGRTWTAANHDRVWMRRVEVCYAAADPKIVYASIENNRGQIWRSSDEGRTFVQRHSLNVDNSPANYLGDQGWYGNVIWAGDPTNADFIVVGGVDLWRSLDGGDKLVDMSSWWSPQSAHADHHVIVAHPKFDGVNNRIVFFGNDGGVYRADDVRSVGNDPNPPRISGWRELNNTFGVTQFYHAAANKRGVIVAGAQDNGTLAFRPETGSERWISIFGGDGGFCAADPTDPNVFYGEYVYLNIHRNTDGAASDDVQGNRYISGQYWNPGTRRWMWKPAPFQIPDAFNQRALFIAPFVIDANQPDRLLAGGESLWRTDDAKTPNTPTKGPKWTRIKAPSNGFISAIAVAQKDSDLVWVGYNNGEIDKSVNGTAANPVWSRIDGSLPTRRYVTRVLISPHDKNTVLVAFGGFAKSNIWITRDGGATWSDLGAGLPAAPVRAVAIHPSEPDWIYLGTEVGVFASEDCGTNWSATNEGPANVSVEDLIWMGETLVCVTHGRGIFRIDLSAGAPMVATARPEAVPGFAFA